MGTPDMINLRKQRCSICSGEVEASPYQNKRGIALLEDEEDYYD